jgi:protein-disulfide isomerase
VKLVLSLVIAAAACSNAPSKLDGSAAKPAMKPSPPATGDTEARLARLEHKLDKVAGALDQALGPAKPDPAARYAVPIEELDPVEGAKDAKITIVEGYEFLCPYCYLADPVVEQVRAKYGKDVRLVSKYLVIHGAPAVTAGTYACAAAKQGKFTEMKAALWGHLFKLEGQAPRLQQDQLTAIPAIAASIGLDPARLEQDAKTCEGWLAASQRDLMQVGVNSTPAFFVNGRPLPDRSFETFDRVIQEELAKVNASGIASADYYAREIVGKGLKQVASRFED